MSGVLITHHLSLITRHYILIPILNSETVIRTHTLFVLVLALLFAPKAGRGQKCFEVDTATSEVFLSSGVVVKLPAAGDTLRIPCQVFIENMAVRLRYSGDTELYFEDSTSFFGLLDAPGPPGYAFTYNKALKVFRLSNPQRMLDGGYTIDFSAIPCAPAGGGCNDCLSNYPFYVEFIEADPGLIVTIASAPSPPVLTCLPGSSVTLMGTPPFHEGFTAQWEQLVGSDFVNIPNATNPEFTTSTAGTYRYTLTGPAGCKASNFSPVSLPEYPGIALGQAEQPLNACSQPITGVEVENSGGANNVAFQWTTSDGGILLGGETTASPLAAALGTYTVVATRTDNGCTDTASIQIIPGDIPNVLVQIAAAAEVLDCRAPSTTLLASASLTSGSSDYLYLWSTGEIGDAITVLAPGIYSVTATATAIGCLGMTEATIFQDITPPTVQILSTRDTLCAGESAILTAMSLELVTYRWQNNATTNTLMVAPNQNGPNGYAVTVTATDNGCTATAEKQIERVDIPQIACAESSLSVPSGTPLSLACTTSGTELIWTALASNVRNIPPAGSGPVQGQVVELVNGQAPGSVRYAFFGKNAGCTSDRADVLVTVLPSSPDDIFIPELITPDGDGQNDTWAIAFRSGLANPEAYRLSLFNRYGALVWEGNIVTPFPADNYPDGTYYYVMKKPDGGAIRGAVTILRRK